MNWLVEKAHAEVTSEQWLDLFSSPANAPANTSIVTTLNHVINIFLWIAGALAVIYLIYSGVLYITAAGNPDQAKKGQQGVINAIIGIVIIVGVFFIIRVATNLARGF